MAGDPRSLSREAFEARLRGLSVRYWDRHPFHVRLHAGACTPDEVRAWVANRWYYQRHMSQKNAAIVANCPLPEVRRRWVERILWQDGPERQDGNAGGEGGLEDWLVLAEAVGLDRRQVLDERHVLPGVRFAVDAYVAFCRTRPWKQGAAAALTELFAPDLMAGRVVAWRRHYDWIKPDGYAYFERRVPTVRAESGYTLDLVLTHCVSREEQDAAVAALAFKCDVLRAMLDAIDYANARP
ncbi:pyrroloquinoline-quinone synthase PqqC [Phytohabitans sp. ZYX-F-186]|uniref:Pyrroloquinoline-quinone synthase n=1 Tax=Phytohabitans maris TaxID=3071409 RepID=A0ABU0ZCM6_9ACTN|nr:pyrroloquinoline-quinone synthase PqqC [Phytohabitans sp. ZYX-F-186]MDQ7904819.1 pyrroloquinoline-quinone synthase PqqC [Phytohabitans sp. ZYX-F-186]